MQHGLVRFAEQSRRMRRLVMQWHSLWAGTAPATALMPS